MNARQEIQRLLSEINKAKQDTAAAIAKIELGNNKLSVEDRKLRLGWFKQFASGFGIFMRDFSPYLVLLVIILLFVGMAAAPAKKSRPGRTLPTTGGSKIKNMLKKFLEMLFPTQTIRKWFNPFGKVDTIPRTQNGGRCDNVGWRQQNDPSEPYGGGLCTRTFDPKPYEWQIDTSKNPDFDKLPSKMQSALTGAKTTVYIPYAKQATFYVPQCNDAYYMQGDQKRKFADDGTPLLVDNGLSCTLAQKPLPAMHTAKFRLPQNANAAGRDQMTACTL